MCRLVLARARAEMCLAQAQVAELGGAAAEVLVPVLVVRLVGSGRAAVELPVQACRPLLEVTAGGLSRCRQCRLWR